MKTLNKILILSFLALGACTDDMIEGTMTDGGGAIVANAPGAEDRARVAIQDADAQNRSKLVWNTGDEFVAYTDQQESIYYRLVGASEVAQAEFRTKESFKGKLTIAAFPASAAPVFTGELLTMTLPNVYTAEMNSQNLPMWGNIQDYKVAFKHLMGVYRMDFKQSARKFQKVIVETSNIIAGEFTMNVANGGTKLVAHNSLKDNYRVTINCSADRNVFYLPLPAGKYGNIKVYGSSDGKDEALILELKDKEVLNGYIYTTDSFKKDSFQAKAWTMFANNTPDNVLLDFSYAGYMHGEVAPPEGNPGGYKVINMKAEILNRGLSARETFIALLKENNMLYMDGFKKSNPKANVIFYFPEGEYVLHDENDNKSDGANTWPGQPGYRPTDPYNPNNRDNKIPGTESSYYGWDSKGNNRSESIIITGGNFIIRGDGRNKTKLIMATPNLPNDQNLLYSSPDMIQVKNNAWLGTKTDQISSVTGNAEKGSFSVTVSEPNKFHKGQWVCLNVVNKDPKMLKKELRYPTYHYYDLDKHLPNTDLYKKGVKVEDYHQIKDISGNTITFVEPIMHEVDAQYGWTLKHYFTYENVGIEDLSFVGNCVGDFVHHRSWMDDGAYKPLSFVRMVNSWIRRVDFVNVSEAMSIISSANCSAYDINITGNRGHSAIRSAGSSRVFIGKVMDRTRGPLKNDYNTIEPEAGQYHACGASKPSMGAVIWNVTWGLDSNFESHATQPRATLIDNCRGGFHQLRQGGADTQVPNHLDDLTIWNMDVQREPEIGGGGSFTPGQYDWWRNDWKYWKILPPTVVGIHGYPVTFDNKQMKYEESNGAPVEPQSLYEAQLERRLGKVPAWLQALK